MSRPCFHCETLNNMRAFMLAYPDYPQVEVLNDLAQIVAELSDTLIKAGKVREIPAASIMVPTESTH